MDDDTRHELECLIDRCMELHHITRVAAIAILFAGLLQLYSELS